VNPAGSVAVVTGAGGGIGAALATRFAADGASAVIVADLDAAAARSVAARIGGVPETLDAADATAVTDLVERTVGRFGRIDLFCANAGITTELGLDAPDALWQRSFEVNVMAHVHAARAVVPHMLARGSGHFLATASAAGLLTAPADAPYSVTKHATVGFAEWLAIAYGDRGIGVSVLCPMGVATPMLMGPLEAGVASARAVAASGEILSPEAVADAVVKGLAAGEFLILPHPEVGTFWAKKAARPDRWLAAMRGLAGRSA
jgi:NAD(P)-dependent dehydrogenase (short-subunit alcohol dehydrogenase family)